MTPNRYEAEELAGMPIRDVDDMKKAAEKIARLGVDAVIIKGGHVESEETVTDILYHKGEFYVFTKPRIRIQTHGSGCTFSAAVAAYLALGFNLFEATSNAESFVKDAVAFSTKIGKGRVPVNSLALIRNEAEKFYVLNDVSKAVEVIEHEPLFAFFIAEVGMQIGMALPYAAEERHVAAVKGRIVRCGKLPKAVGCVEYGASSHIARIILTAMKHDPLKRAALNLRYDTQLVEAFRQLGFTVASFDRKYEPKEIKTKEGSTLSWGINEAIRKAGKVPEVIYDLGDVGKEPMIRVLGSSATEVAENALKAIQQTQQFCK